MIKAVIFDMFETLVTHYRSPLYFGTQIAEDAGIPPECFLPVWRDTESDRTIGSLTLDEVIARILHENSRYSDELLQKILQKRIAAKEDCFRQMHAEILPLFRALHAQGLKIGLISNCFSEEASVIRRSVLFPFFDAAFLSYEQGIQKPDPEIFRRCIQALDVRPEECLYVGDGGSRELETARSLGMHPVQAVWYQPDKRNPEFTQAETPLQILQYFSEKMEDE